MKSPIMWCNVCGLTVQERLCWWTATITSAGRETADYEFIKWKFNELNEITIWEPPISLLQLIISAHHSSLWWENEESLYRSRISRSDTQSWILIEFIDNEKKKKERKKNDGLRGTTVTLRMSLSLSLSFCACTSLSLYPSLSTSP